MLIENFILIFNNFYNFYNFPQSIVGKLFSYKQFFNPFSHEINLYFFPCCLLEVLEKVYFQVSLYYLVDVYQAFL